MGKFKELVSKMDILMSVFVLFALVFLMFQNYVLAVGLAIVGAMHCYKAYLHSKDENSVSMQLAQKIAQLEAKLHTVQLKNNVQNPDQKRRMF